MQVDLPCDPADPLSLPFCQRRSGRADNFQRPRDPRGVAGIEGGGTGRVVGSGAEVFGTPVAVTGAMLIGLGFSPLQAGELIMTGSWTDSLPVKRGEVWSSAFSQLNLPGLNLSFS